MHYEGKTRILHRPRLMDAVIGKIGRKACVVKGIDNRREQKGNNNGIRDDGGFCSPMSVTRSKKGLEEGERGGPSNVSKTI